MILCLIIVDYGMIYYPTSIELQDYRDITAPREFDSSTSRGFVVAMLIFQYL